MITEEIKCLVESNALGFATVDEEGNPHCIAVAYVKVFDDNKFLVSDNYLGETIKNIQSNNDVALVVWNKEWEDDCKGFELKGSAEYFNSGKWHDVVKKLPENKGMPAKGAILVTINKINKLA